MARETSEVIGARYPRAIPGSARYELDGEASGAAGAVARIGIQVDNYPQILLRVSVAHEYEIDPAYVDTNPLAYQGMRELDDAAEITITATQQNITARPVHLRTWQGRGGWLYQPLSAPYIVGGSNQITVELRRLIAYPSLNEVAILPVAYVTAFTVSLQSDLAPGVPRPQGTGAWPAPQR